MPQPLALGSDFNHHALLARWTIPQTLPTNPLRSAYFSTPHLASAIRSGDLNASTTLESVVRTRAYRGELILFAFDFCAIAEALNLIVHLRALGFEHHVPLTDGDATCAALRRAARARGLAEPPCFWSSWPTMHPGWTWWGSKPGCVTAERAHRACAIEQLWTTRYAVAAQLLAAGANVLHVDTDSLLLADPYRALAAPPLAARALVFMFENPANGGTWYARSGAGGGGRWVIAEVARRTLAVIELRPPNKRLPPFDQAMLGDVLLTSADGAPHWNMACEHPQVGPSPLCAGGRNNKTRGARRLRWSGTVPACDPAGGACVGPHLRRYGYNGRIRVFEMKDDAGRPLGTAAEAPPWLFPREWLFQKASAFGAARPEAAVVHLLGARCRWCVASEDVDKGAKWEWQHLAGFWAAAAYTLSPERSPAAAASAAAPPDDDAAATAEHCWKKGRARLLRAHARYATLAPAALAEAERADDGGAAARTLVRRFLGVATLLGRVAVLPAFNCSAPWIERRADTGAVSDLRVVVRDASVPRPPAAQRCSPCNVQFACRRSVLSEGQWDAVRALRGWERRAFPPFRLPLGADGAVDARALFAAHTAVAAEDAIELASLADVRGGVGDVDAPLLRSFPALASEVSRLLCDVTMGDRPGKAHCEGGGAAERAQQLQAWRRLADDGAGRRSSPRRSQVGPPGMSVVAIRLGWRCADLLCSDEPCDKAARRECAAQLARGGAAQRAAEEACERWYRKLPLGLRALCDGFSGRCVPPPEAHASRVHWPAAACVSEPGDRLCSGAGGAPCASCVVKS